VSHSDPKPSPADDPALDEMLAEAAELSDADEALSLCRELLARGARTDGLARTTGSTALDIAIHREHWDLCRLLLEAGALERSEWDMRDRIWDLGVSAPLDIVDLAVRRVPDGWSIFLPGDNGQLWDSPLHHLAAEGQKDRVLALLDLGASVLLDAGDSLERTLLAHALGSGHLTLAQALIDRGADVNAHGHTGTGFTPLDDAIQDNDPLRVAFLLERRANPNIPTWMWVTAADRVHTSGLDAATRELVLAAARKFPPPVYPDGTRPIVWPPGKDTPRPNRR
jgi:ankyrin repeat protein